jgi:muconolactone D-isomerase
MEIMTRIRVTFPADMDADIKSAILKEERERGTALRESGTILRTWRVPGRVETVQVWRVKNPTELHDILASLPVYPWLSNVEVEALAEHPIDPTSHEVPSGRA